MGAVARVLLSGRLLEEALAARRTGGGRLPDAVVIIDVLRFTTTLIHAFSRGATGARAFPNAESAERAKKALPPGSTVLCGERGGVAIPGFDLGNSPREYIAEFVFSRTLLFCTTNGTRALLRTRDARRQLIAAFVNVGAVARRLRALAAEAAAGPGDFEAWIVAAGNADEPSDEDAACALALADALVLGDAGPPFAIELSAEGETWPRTILPSRGADDQALAAWLAATEHGRALLALDPAFARDIVDAARRDAFDLVPEGRAGVIDALVRGAPSGAAPRRTG